MSVSIPFLIDGDWTTPQPHGEKRIFYPFENDDKSFYFEQDYKVLTANYQRAKLSTVRVVVFGGSTYRTYLTNESATRDEGGGVCQFTRTYAIIPFDRISFEQFAFTFPGITGQGAGAPKAISNVHTSSDDTTTTIAYTAGGGSYSTGDDVFVTLDYVDAVSQTEVTNVFFRKVLSTTTVSGLSAIVVDLIQEPGAITWMNLRLARVGRQPLTRVVGSFVNFKYYLPGVTPGINTYADIPILTPTIIVGSDGIVTNSYSYITTPDVTAWDAIVNATPPANQIVAEASVVRIWKGNIYERATRYVVAQ